jgi:hypothetical protein
VLWLCGGACVVEAPSPDCDQDGDGYCLEEQGGMPGGDCCDELGNEGCSGDATQPGSIHPGAEETCADIGIDNDCDGNAEDVDGLGDVCNTGICDNDSCLCKFGELVCRGGTLDCEPQFEKDELPEICDGIDQDCDGIDDWEDQDALWFCMDPANGGDAYKCTFVSEREAICREGCRNDTECEPAGNRCYKDPPSEEYGQCICGDDLGDHVCGRNFVCGEVPDVMPGSPASAERTRSAARTRAAPAPASAPAETSWVPASTRSRPAPTSRTRRTATAALNRRDATASARSARSGRRAASIPQRNMEPAST